MNLLIDTMRPPDLALELVLRAAWRERQLLRQVDLLLPVVKELNMTTKLVAAYPDKISMGTLVESFGLLGQAARIALDQVKHP